MTIHEIRDWYEDFDGDRVYSTTADAKGWKKLETKTAGSPSVATVSGEATGAVALTLDNTSEVQSETLYQGDVLSWALASNVQRVRFNCKAATIGSNSTIDFGFASADNSGSPANYCWFKCSGSTSVLVETADGTTTNSGVATGQVIATTYKSFDIDFSYGLSDVRFYVENANGQLQRVAPATTFSMAALSGSLQLYIRCKKASSTDAPVLTVDSVNVQYKK